MTTREVFQALQKRHQPPEWAFLSEVADGTGAVSHRKADAIVMNLWPSRGLELHGFEIKSDRGDWLTEIATPQKAEAVCKYCHRWWVAVGDAAIVRPGELPPTWGLLVPHSNNTLRIEVEAPKLVPLDISRSFLAALLRRSTEQSADVHQLNSSYQQGLKQGEWNAKQAIDGWQRRAEDAERRIKQFQEDSGIDINAPVGGDFLRVGNLVKAIQLNMIPIDDIERCSQEVDDLAKAMKKALALLKKTELPFPKNPESWE